MRRVTPLQEGSLFETKRMEGGPGTSFPRHRASTESVLVVTEGHCIITLSDTDHSLEAGDSFVVPADEWHQVLANPDFKAVHIMPKEIEFVFSA